MKLLQAHPDAFVFEFNARERELLGAVLRLYPLLNPDYHQVAREPGDARIRESQALLREALAASQAEGKARVAAFLEDENWPRAARGCFLLTLDAEEMEWLLQVLNDVRVGSWVRLGKPDTGRGEAPPETPETLPYLGAMELAGLFQSAFLAAAHQ